MSYAVYTGSVLPTFRDNLPVTNSRVKQSNLEDGTLFGLMTLQMRPIDCPETTILRCVKSKKYRFRKKKKVLITAIELWPIKSPNLMKTKAIVCSSQKCTIVYFFNSIPVPCILYCFVLWPTNAQLFHKLSHSYMFRHYRVILRELVINTLPSYTSISNAAVGNTINIHEHDTIVSKHVGVWYSWYNCAFVGHIAK